MTFKVKWMKNEKEIWHKGKFKTYYKAKQWCRNHRYNEMTIVKYENNEIIGEKKLFT